MGKEDTVEVCRGLKAEVESAKTIDEYGKFFSLQFLSPPSTTGELIGYLVVISPRQPESQLFSTPTTFCRNGSFDYRTPNETRRECERLFEELPHEVEDRKKGRRTRDHESREEWSWGKEEQRFEKGRHGKF